MNSFLKSEESAACELVTRASFLLAQQQSSLSISDTFIKPDGSLVTIFDFAIQAALCEKILSLFPHDIFIGEENSASLKAHPELVNKVLFIAQQINSSVSADNLFELLTPAPLIHNSQRVWTSDPLDGTGGFATNRECAVTLGLIENDQPVLGIIGCPTYTYKNRSQTVLFVTKKNHGSWIFTDYPYKSERLSISKTITDRPIVYAEARFSSTYHNHLLSLKAMQHCCKKYPFTALRKDSQTKYGYVATQDADIFICLPFKTREDQTWDHVAGILLIEEAGGYCSDMIGRPLTFSNKYVLQGTRGIVAGNPSLCPLLTDYFKKNYQ